MSRHQISDAQSPAPSQVCMVALGRLGNRHRVGVRRGQQHAVQQVEHAQRGDERRHPQLDRDEAVDEADPSRDRQREQDRRDRGDRVEVDRVVHQVRRQRGDHPDRDVDLAADQQQHDAHRDDRGRRGGLGDVAQIVRASGRSASRPGSTPSGRSRRAARSPPAGAGTRRPPIARSATAGARRCRRPVWTRWPRSSCLTPFVAGGPGAVRWDGARRMRLSRGRSARCARPASARCPSPRTGSWCSGTGRRCPW